MEGWSVREESVREESVRVSGVGGQSGESVEVSGVEGGRDGKWCVGASGVKLESPFLSLPLQIQNSGMWLHSHPPQGRTQKGGGGNLPPPPPEI